jgi:hypothetical protein
VSTRFPKFRKLLRIQMPGAPEKDIDEGLEDFEALAAPAVATEAAAPAVPDDVSNRLSAIEAAIKDLKAEAANAPAASSEDATVVQRLDAIDRAFIALQGSVSKLEAAAAEAEALHKRISALEAARPTAAPARAAAPAARPAASA